MARRFQQGEENVRRLSSYFEPLTTRLASARCPTIALPLNLTRVDEDEGGKGFSSERAPANHTASSRCARTDTI
jgi:hypothetical protein